MKRRLKKDVVVHRSLVFGKIDIWNPGLVVSRDLDIDFTNSDLIK